MKSVPRPKRKGFRKLRELDQLRRKLTFDDISESLFRCYNNLSKTILTNEYEVTKLDREAIWLTTDGTRLR